MGKGDTRTSMVYDMEDISSYLKLARSFRSEVYVKYKENYHLLEGAAVSNVDTKNRLFSLNTEVDQELRKQQKIMFRILLETTTCDFTTRVFSKDDYEGKQFFIPKQLTVHYERKSQRIKPSEGHPIIVKFRLKRLMLKFHALDISLEGIAVKVPNAELLLDAGDILEDMEIILNEVAGFTVTGQVRLIKKEKCGIKFLDPAPGVTGLIAKYIERRELAEIVRDKLYVDVEDDIMKFG